MDKNKIVLFDFDRVIVDSFTLGRKTSEENGLVLPEKEYRALFEVNIF